MAKKELEANAADLAAVPSMERRGFMQAVLVVLAVWSALCLTAEPALSQKPPTAKEILRPLSQVSPPADPLGRSTPEGTVIGFLKAAQKGEYERAVDYLDTKRSHRLASELAQQLLVVLDRGVKLNVTTLSRNPGSVNLFV